MTREEAMREAADRSILAPASDGLAPIAAAGADAERARIVAWLRAGFDTYPQGTFARCGELQNYWNDAADAIERGDHWPRKEGE